PAGPAKVTVESLEPPTADQLKSNEARAKMYPLAAEIPPELKELASGPKLPYMRISTKYSAPETSGLTFEVKRGTNTYDIPLTECPGAAVLREGRGADAPAAPAVRPVRPPSTSASCWRATARPPRLLGLARCRHLQGQTDEARR